MLGNFFSSRREVLGNDRTLRALFSCLKYLEDDPTVNRAKKGEEKKEKWWSGEDSTAPRVFSGPGYREDLCKIKPKGRR